MAKRGRPAGENVKPIIEQLADKGFDLDNIEFTSADTRKRFVECLMSICLKEALIGGSDVKEIKNIVETATEIFEKINYDQVIEIEKKLVTLEKKFAVMDIKMQKVIDENRELKLKGVKLGATG